MKISSFLIFSADATRIRRSVNFYDNALNLNAFYDPSKYVQNIVFNDFTKRLHLLTEHMVAFAITLQATGNFRSLDFRLRDQLMRPTPSAKRTKTVSPASETSSATSAFLKAKTMCSATRVASALTRGTLANAPCASARSRLRSNRQTLNTLDRTNSIGCFLEKIISKLKSAVSQLAEIISINIFQPIYVLLKTSF